MRCFVDVYECVSMVVMPSYRVGTRSKFLIFRYDHSMSKRDALTSFYTITGLFISPSETSELDCATTKTDTAERSISIGRESLNVFFVLGALAYLQVPPLGGSRDEKWSAQ